MIKQIGICTNGNQKKVKQNMIGSKFKSPCVRIHWSGTLNLFKLIDLKLIVRDAYCDHLLLWMNSTLWMKVGGA